MPQKYELHQFCIVMPVRSPDEIQEIANDMKICGYQADRPIILFQGKILDGRHRLQAAEIAGVEPVFKDFEGDFEGARALVKRENMNPRRYNQGQIAVVAAQLNAIRNEDGSSSDTAENIGVSDRTQRRAERVVEHAAPEIVAKVLDGSVSLKEAEKTIVPKKRAAKPEKTLAEKLKLPAAAKSLERIAKLCGKKVADDIVSGKIDQITDKDVILWGGVDSDEDVKRIGSLVTRHNMTAIRAWSFLDEMETPQHKIERLLWIAESNETEPYVTQIDGFVITVQRPKRRK